MRAQEKFRSKRVQTNLISPKGDSEEVADQVKDGEERGKLKSKESRRQEEGNRDLRC